jgi:hypothetical protein
MVRGCGVQWEWRQVGEWERDEAASFKRFEEIESWEMARTLTRTIHQVSAKGDFSRNFAMRNHVRTCGVGPKPQHQPPVVIPMRALPAA